MQWDMDERVYYGYRIILLVYSKAPFMPINLNERLAQAVSALGHRDFRLFFAGLHQGLAYLSGYHHRHLSQPPIRLHVLQSSLTSYRRISC